MFDGIFLTKIEKEFEALKTGRISKINEISDTDFIFQIRANRKNYNLLISLSSEYQRIHLAYKLYDSVKNYHNFTMLLKKYLEGFFIEDIILYNSDRIISFKLKGYNDMQDLTTYNLYVELLGRYSNLVLTDEKNIIIDALKRDGVSEVARTILPNATYTILESGKLDPLKLSEAEIAQIFEDKNICDAKGVIANFNGVSNNILFETFLSNSPKKRFYELLNLDNKPSIIVNQKGKIDFYFNPFSFEVKDEFLSLSELCESFYFEEDLRLKVKQKTGNLGQFIDKKLQKLNEKKLKLEQELFETNKMDDIKLKAELLMSMPNIHDKKDDVLAYNYYDNSYLKIELDPSITIIDNSKKLYKKYEKIKSSIKYINEQLEITNNEINYFKELKYEINVASLNEALQIKDELVENKYLFIQDKSNKKKRKENINLLTYILPTGTLVSVGKNNIQNNYLTWKKAKSNEMWFHVKDETGSHVILHKTDDILDEEIRYAALIAAYYSNARESSSVKVDYTLQRNIKKVPGIKGSFVTYKNQKTIYIDPDKKLIDKLEVKKI